MFEAIEGYSQQLLEFIRMNQGWAPPIVALLAFGESLAFISLLLPGIPYAYVSSVHGIQPTAPEGLISWNVQEWTLTA